jgi:hypothetical protein
MAGRLHVPQRRFLRRRTGEKSDAPEAPCRANAPQKVTEKLKNRAPSARRSSTLGLGSCPLFAFALARRTAHGVFRRPIFSRSMPLIRALVQRRRFPVARALGLAWLGLAWFELAGCASLFGLEDGWRPPEAVGQGGSAGTSGGSSTQGGNSSGGDAQSGSSGAAGSPEPPEDAAVDATAAIDACTEYCALLGVACTGANRAYAQPEDCAALCPFFPRGEPNVEGVNTLECRLAHAAVATAEPSSECLVAGRGGTEGFNQVCGSNCEAYCDLMSKLCPSQYAIDYGSDAATAQNACLTTCATLGDCGNLDVRAFDEGGRDDRGGSTVQCRLWHLGLAASIGTINNTLHCGHASNSPNDRCSTDAPATCPVPLTTAE